MTSMVISSVLSPVAINCIDWTQGQGMPGISDYQVEPAVRTLRA
jgi:hypothetical protein